MGPSPIVIVGFMGCGKTAVARELAQIRNEPFVDLDARIEEQEGRAAAQVIVENGETEFRQKETLALRRLLRSDTNDVIALGGGAWTIEANRDLVRERRSVVVWLDVPFDLCWKRISEHSGVRPLAPTRDVAQKLYTERRPIYGLADFQVGVVADETPVQVAKRIAALLQHESHT